MRLMILLIATLSMVVIAKEKQIRKRAVREYTSRENIIPSAKELKILPVHENQYELENLIWPFINKNYAKDAWKEETLGSFLEMKQNLFVKPVKVHRDLIPTPVISTATPAIEIMSESEMELASQLFAQRYATMKLSMTVQPIINKQPTLQEPLNL